LSIPFDIPIGRILIHAGRRIRFEGDLGNWVLRFSDVRTGGPVQVTDPKTGQLVLTAVEWVRQEMLAGRLFDPLAGRLSAEGRQLEFAGLDSPACIKRDPKSAWRFRWGWAVLQAGIERTDEAYGKFIARRAADLARNDDLGEPKPSTLRRWVRRLQKGGARTSTLVSLSGRVHGQSQLCPLDDGLVHDAAIYYWAEPGASIRDAESYMVGEREKLIAEGCTELPREAPTYETVRLRVRSLESHDTSKTKFGKAYADKEFNEVGDHVQATRFGERVYFDGTETRT
jgi:hypothetical protein